MVLQQLEAIIKIYCVYKNYQKIYTAVNKKKLTTIKENWRNEIKHLHTA